MSFLLPATRRPCLGVLRLPRCAPPREKFRPARTCLAAVHTRPPARFPPAAVNASTWRMHKLGQPISPLEVALNGSQAQHAVGDDGLTVDSADGRHRLRIR